MAENQRPSILVVDDNEAIAELYADWLKADYDVVTAYDGADARGVLDESVDVVLLDRRMPGQHGDAVLAELRGRGIDARVVMVTAVSPDLDVVELGFDDYLLKPVTPEELESTVERMLEVAQFDAELQQYYALVNKMALLETELPHATLQESEEYHTLREEVDAMRARLEELGTEFQTTHYESLFRGMNSVEDGQPTPT